MDWDTGLKPVLFLHPPFGELSRVVRIKKMEEDSLNIGRFVLQQVNGTLTVEIWFFKEKTSRFSINTSGQFIVILDQW